MVDAGGSQAVTETVCCCCTLIVGCRYGFTFHGFILAPPILVEIKWHEMLKYGTISNIIMVAQETEDVYDRNDQTADSDCKGTG